MKRKWFLGVFLTGLFLLAASFFGAFSSFSGKLDRDALVEDYEYLWGILEDNFPLFEAAEARYGIDRKEIYNRYKDSLIQSEEMDLADFYQLLSACLDEFHYVGHLSVADVEMFKLYQDEADHYVELREGALWVYEDERAERAYEYLEKKSGGEEKQAGKGTIGSEAENNIYLRYSGDIPIITIDSFYCANLDETERMTEKLKSVLKECRQAEDIVIDLRGNSGGNTAVWQYGFLPFLGKKEVTTTSYLACMNGEFNQSIFPFDFMEETEYHSAGDGRNTEFEIACYPIHADTDIREIAGREMDALNDSEIIRCDLFLKVTKRLEFTEEERWAAEGDLWCFIDESTASAALDFAMTLKDAGLAVILASGDGQVGKIGGLTLPPAQAMVLLPNSGLIVRYAPYYIMNSDGSCTEFGMWPDFVVDDMEFWVWEKGK